MDMGFFRRNERRLQGCAEVPLAYEALINAIGEAQSATAAAQAETRCKSAAPDFGTTEPLVEIILGTSVWKEAVPAQRGSFNRGRADLIAGGKPK